MGNLIIVPITLAVLASQLVGVGIRLLVPITVIVRVTKRGDAVLAPAAAVVFRPGALVGVRLKAVRVHSTAVLVGAARPRPCAVRVGGSKRRRTARRQVDWSCFGDRRAAREAMNAKWLRLCKLGVGLIGFRRRSQFVAQRGVSRTGIPGPLGLALAIVANALVGGVVGKSIPVAVAIRATQRVVAVLAPAAAVFRPGALAGVRREAVPAHASAIMVGAARPRPCDVRDPLHRSQSRPQRRGAP